MDCPVAARPTVIVISDSLGDTACEVVLAASGQFDEGAFRVLRLPKVTSVEQVKSFVGPRVDADHRDIAVFHTIVDPALRARVLDYLGMLHIRSHIQDAAVDVFGLSGLQGRQRSVGARYGAAQVDLRGRPDAVVWPDFDRRRYF